MKRFLPSLFLAVVGAAGAFSVHAQRSGNVIIGLLNKTPDETIENCSGSDLMNLLTDDGKTWIESIECKNVNIVKGAAGAQLILNQSTDYNSYIQFNFKSDQQLQATNVTFYGSDKEAEGYVTATVSVNKTAYSTYYKNVNYFFVQESANLTKIESASAADILKSISDGGNDVTPLPARIVVNSLPSENRVESCRIEYNSKADARADNIKIFALRVYYNGMFDNTDSAVELISDNAADENIQYFDLFGHKLSSAPEKGIYLRKLNGVTTKHIAH